MRTINVEENARATSAGRQDRRIIMDRRISSGRRKMIRFDLTGGDRRSAYARRSTDTGFREYFDGE